MEFQCVTVLGQALTRQPLWGGDAEDGTRSGLQPVG